MKYAVISLVLLLAGFATSLGAGSTQCVTIERCPDNKKTADCCEPPPCEFFEHIRIKKATRDLYNRPEVRKRLLKKAHGDNREAALMLDEWVKTEAPKLGKTMVCDWEEPYSYAGQFETKSWCQIYQNLGKDANHDEDQLVEMTKQKALDSINTCSEFIEAIWSHEGHHIERCTTTDGVTRSNEGLSVFAKEETEGYNREIGHLKDSLNQYYVACSAVLDSKTEQQLAEAGIRVLKKKAPKSPPAKKRSKSG